MKDSALRLQDKTILLVGPFNGVTQAILRTLTEFGADVGYISEQPAGRYVEGINEARDQHPHYGRAAHYNLALNNEKQIQEALGQVVGTLGRMDALIDASPLGWNAKTDPQAASTVCMGLAEKLVPFFLVKQRGRIIYLLEDPCLDSMRPEGVAAGCREILTTMIESLGVKYRSQNVTVNALSIGITDDFILRLSPKTPSLKRAFEELQKTHTGLKLVELNDVGLSAAHLCSALSASLTGQMLRLTHGYHLPAPSL
jgi:NAD(P)-dependent dehydrogenase (short-subunit alcohol dehydrogenase family)